VEAASPLLEEGNFGIRMDVGFIYSGSFLQTCGGDFLDPSGVLHFTVEAGQCWLEILDEWSIGGLPVHNSGRDLEAFKSGQAAWLVDGTWNAPQIIKALGADQVAIDLWPIYAPTEKALTGYAWSRNIFFGVSASDADFDAAWILARYLLTPDVQLDFGESTFGLHVPVLRSVPTIQPWLQELLAAMENNIPVPQFPELAIFIEHLEVAAYDVSRRGYDPYYSILWAYPKIEKDLRFADLSDE
jgi:ABC-type glycerol-3-phosphate transport system substrate-binding protein